MRLSTREPKRIRVNGAAVASAEELRSRVHTLAFTPDRLAVVKGGPATRRAYFDRVLARVLPARADVPAPTVPRSGSGTQRCAGSPRASRTRRALEPWTEQVVTLAAQLVEARAAGAGAPGAAVRGARGGARPPRRDARLRGGPTLARDARRPPRPRSRARHDRRRAAPRRRTHPLGRPRPPHVRLAGRAADGRSRRSSSRRRSYSPPTAASLRSSCSTTRSPSSTATGAAG